MYSHSLKKHKNGSNFLLIRKWVNYILTKGNKVLGGKGSALGRVLVLEVNVGRLEVLLLDLDVLLQGSTAELFVGNVSSVDNFVV